MLIEHIAIWTRQLETLKEYYKKYFRGKPNDKYVNPAKQFESYFISFESGARLEIMSKPGIPENVNDSVNQQYLGIIHLAFGVESMQDVDKKANELKKDGYSILSGPRKTGDGYYEFETLDPDNNRIEVTTKFVD
jgi:lactoylglutathione lyase